MMHRREPCREAALHMPVFRGTGSCGEPNGKAVPMAVYTEVSDEELEQFIAEYDIGEVLSCKGIAEGVENSNYLLQTDTGHYILTLYERRVSPEDLPYFLNLMEHLAAQDIPCPTPLHARDGKSLRELCGRPAATSPPRR